MEPGWRFDPFDDELINDYLKPKILGEQLPRNYLVKNAQVYGPASNPWQIFHPNHHSWLNSRTTLRYMFVFAKLSKLSTSDSSKNTSKKAGCGTWVGKTSRKKILDHLGNLIGESRYLVFEVNDTDPAALGLGVDFNNLGSYTMHEYRLSGINAALNSADAVVVCKITHDPSKRPALALKSSTKIANCLSTNTSEAQIREGNNSCLGGTACLVTENPTQLVVETMNNPIPMNSGLADNFEERGTLTSECLAVIYSDVGIKIANSLSTTTSEAQIGQENNSCLGGTACLATENPTQMLVETRNNLIPMDSCLADNFKERGTLTSECVAVMHSDAGIKIANCVSTTTSGAQTENPTVIDGRACDHLDETRVADNLEVNSEIFPVINTDVGEWCAAPQYSPLRINALWDDCGEGGVCLDDLGGGYSSVADLDVFTDWDPTESIVECLDSNHKEEPVGNKLWEKKI